MVLKLLTTLSVAALAGGAYLTNRQSNERMDAAVNGFPPEGDLIDIGGRHVHAVTRGKGPDVILIHGAGGNTREFTFSFMERLTDRYRVTAFDRPGLGYTDRATAVYDDPYNTNAESPSEQAAMLDAASEKLGIKNAIIVGHSFGASVALACALDYPDRVAGVVNLAGPSHPWPGSLGAYYWANASLVGGAVLPPLISAFASDTRIDEAIKGIFHPQPVPDGYAEHIGATLTIRPDSMRANTRQVNGLYPHIVEMAKRYRDELTVPLEIIHGDQDTTVPLDIHSIPLQQAVPHANLTVLDGIGHMPHHTHPELVEAAIDKIAAQATP